MTNKPILFCPQCDTLILATAACPACAWQRPPAGGRPGDILWQQPLSGQPAGDRALALGAGVWGAGLLFASLKIGDISPAQGVIVALDLAGGQEKWRHELPPHLLCPTPVYAGGRLLIASENVEVLPSRSDNRLLALEADSGQMAWEYPVAAHSLSAPAVQQDLVFFVASDRKGYGLRLSDGRCQWQTEPLPTWDRNEPLNGDGLFYSGSKTAAVVAVSVADGRWQTILTGQQTAAWRHTAADNLAYSPGRLYVVQGKELYALDSQSLEQQWRQTAGRGVTGGLAVGRHLYLGVKAPEPRTYLLAAYDRQTGERRWTVAAARYFSAPPLIAAGLVLAPCEDGRLYAIEADSGQIRWQTELGSKLRYRPLLAGDVLYLIDRQGQVTAVAWRQPEPAAALQAPAVYRTNGEWEMAGIAAALEQDWPAAAHDFEQAGQPYRAAQLWQKAGEPDRAAPLFLTAERPELAAPAFQAAGDGPAEAQAWLAAGEFKKAAELYESLEELEPAAEAYEKAGLLMQAAICYAQAGNNGRAVKLYLALDQPAAAAALAERSGELDRAVAILVEARLLDKAAEALRRHHRHADAAGLWEQQGQFEQAAAVWREQGDWAMAADVYERAGAWEKAAVIWKEQGKLKQAAAAYEKAGQLRHAARLYLRLKENKRGMALLQQINAIDEIARYHEENQDWRGAAEAYLQMTPPQPLKAADCYDQAGLWAEAADLYEHSEKPAEAAHGWEKANEPLRAAQLFEQMGNKKDAARLFEQGGEPLKAAELWESLRHLEEAVRLYQLADAPERALSLLERSQAWGQLRHLANELSDYEREARACLALAETGQHELYLGAAQAYERAAREAARQAAGQEEAAIASLWEKAAHYYADWEPEKAQACYQELLRWRRWPELKVEVKAVGELILEQWHELSMEVHNIGYGAARFISVRVLNTEQFAIDGQRTQNLNNLLPQKQRAISLTVRALESGSFVPINLELSFLGPDDSGFRRQINGRVPVKAIGSQAMTPHFITPSGVTPTTVYQIYTDKAEFFSDSSQKVEGDVVSGQKGDRVEINRGGAGSSVQVTADEAQRAPTASPGCAEGRHNIQPGERYCADCGQEVL